MDVIYNDQMVSSGITDNAWFKLLLWSGFECLIASPVAGCMLMYVPTIISSHHLLDISPSRQSLTAPLHTRSTSGGECEIVSTT